MDKPAVFTLKVMKAAQDLYLKNCAINESNGGDRENNFTFHIHNYIE